MVDQTPEELRTHFEEQLGFLRDSAASFDSGNRAEAKRLAHAIRVLLHGTSVSKAAVGLVTPLDQISFLDSVGEIEPSNMLTSLNLAAIQITPAGASYEPAFDMSIAATPSQLLPPAIQAALDAKFLAEHGRAISRAGDWQPFNVWWKLPVVKDDQNQEFSRRDLVLAVANKDGGSHVDPQLPVLYARLSRSNSLAWTRIAKDEYSPMGNPIPAFMRQIAYEVDASISHQFPDLSPTK